MVRDEVFERIVSEGEMAKFAQSFGIEVNAIWNNGIRQEGTIQCGLKMFNNYCLICLEGLDSQ